MPFFFACKSVSERINVFGKHEVALISTLFARIISTAIHQRFCGQTDYAASRGGMRILERVDAASSNDISVVRNAKDHRSFITFQLGRAGSYANVINVVPKSRIYPAYDALSTKMGAIRVR